MNMGGQHKAAQSLIPYDHSSSELTVQREDGSERLSLMICPTCGTPLFAVWAVCPRCQVCGAGAGG